MALEEATASDAPLDWRPRLERYLHTLIEVFIKYPSIGCDAFATDTFGQGELHCIEFVLGCLRDAGLSGDRLVHYYGALESYTLGHGSGIAQEVLAKPSSDGHEPWLEVWVLENPGGRISFTGIETSLEPTPAGARSVLARLKWALT